MRAVEDSLERGEIDHFVAERVLKQKRETQYGLDDDMGASMFEVEEKPAKERSGSRGKKEGRSKRNRNTLASVRSTLFGKHDHNSSDEDSGNEHESHPKPTKRQPKLGKRFSHWFGPEEPTESKQELEFADFLRWKKQAAKSEKAGKDGVEMDDESGDDNDVERDRPGKKKRGDRLSRWLSNSKSSGSQRPDPSKSKKYKKDEPEKREWDIDDMDDMDEADLDELVNAALEEATEAEKKRERRKSRRKSGSGGRRRS